MFPCIHQKESACSICIFGVSCVKAALTKKCSLLVSCNTCNRDRCSKQICFRITQNTAGWNDLRHHLHRNIKQSHKLTIPFQGIDIEEHGASSIGHIRCMHLTTGQIPDEPTINSAKEKLSTTCPIPCAFNVIQNPSKFCCREIRIYQQSGLIAYCFDKPLGLKFITNLGGTSALPYYCVCDRLSGILVPNHGRFTLIGDTDRGDICRCCTDLFHGSTCYLKLSIPDTASIMLNPPLLREDLRKFLGNHAANLTVKIKQNTA